MLPCANAYWHREHANSYISFINNTAISLYKRDSVLLLFFYCILSSQYNIMVSHRDFLRCCESRHYCCDHETPKVQSLKLGVPCMAYSTSKSRDATCIHLWSLASAAPVEIIL